ncbi:protein translocase subunit SecD [Patescibacteria group bacterium]|nr:protein translocase subunit SecD [Patescibacteria group bacterium]
MSTTTSVAHARRNAGWLLALLIVSALIAYPRPLNWLLTQAKQVVGVNIGPVNVPFVLGLDLQGGTHLEYVADVSHVADSERAGALEGVRDVIERRVNTLGVSEPLIQTTRAGDSWRVTVELAGIKEIKQAIDLIGETPILEFKEHNDNPVQRALTADEQQKLAADNQIALKKASDLLEEAKKPGADLAALANQTMNADLLKTKGDTGFLKGQDQYYDIYTDTKTIPAGTLVDHVIERSNSYAVVKVEEVKDTGEQEINASHLLIGYQGAQSSASTSTKEEAKKKIEDLKKQLTPQNFAEFAGKYSEEPGAATRGGSLGWFAKGDMIDAFESVALPQATGTISNVVETPYGFHLIYKVDQRPLKDVRVRMIEIRKLVETDIAPAPEEWTATKLTGRDVASAKIDFDPRTGVPQVSLQFNSEGAKAFGELTQKNIGKQIAIFLDGQILSAPTVQNQILGGQAMISGNFTVPAARDLARRLQAGALPVPIQLIAQQTVGPTLGADSLQSSLYAGLAGFAFVALFMILVYRLPGLISVLALVLYAMISAVIFKLVPVTLSLAGIAGFILSLGIAVDANVLTFERLKEEWLTGRPLLQVLEEAFRRAWPSIRDGHVTVLISCAVLYWFSSSIIRGFALTLAIGTTISLFTAIVSTRSILRFVATTPLKRFEWLMLKPRA